MINRRYVLLRHGRRRAVSHVHTIRIDQENGAQHFSRFFLDHAQERVERPRQGHSLGQQFEQLELIHRSSVRGP